MTILCNMWTFSPIRVPTCCRLLPETFFSTARLRPVTSHGGPSTCLGRHPTPDCLPDASLTPLGRQHPVSGCLSAGRASPPWLSAESCPQLPFSQPATFLNLASLCHSSLPPPPPSRTHLLCFELKYQQEKRESFLKFGMAFYFST